MPGIHLMKVTELNPFASVKKAFFLLFASSALLISTGAQALEPKPFDQNSLQTIEKAYDGQPFLLSVWSMECLPCHKELKLLGELANEYPDFNLVLISTDGLEQAEATDAFLSSFQLSNVDSWIYASEDQDRLRYSIDKNWYGEMPRSYFYDHQGQRQAASGLLSEQILRNWMSAHPARSESIQQ